MQTGSKENDSLFSLLLLLTLNQHSATFQPLDSLSYDIICLRANENAETVETVFLMKMQNTDARPIRRY